VRIGIWTISSVKIGNWLPFALDPTGGAYSAPQTVRPPSWFRGWGPGERGGEGRGKGWREGERKGGVPECPNSELASLVLQHVMQTRMSSDNGDSLTETLKSVICSTNK